MSRVISNGLMKDWKNVWEKTIVLASQEYATMTRRMIRHDHCHYYYNAPRLRLRVVRRLGEVNVLRNAFDNWNNAAPSKGQRRWIQSQQQSSVGVQIGPVRATNLQKDRLKRIVHYRQGLHWPKILEMFLNEKEHYGLIELATTLSQLTKFPTFNRDHPDLPELLEAIAIRIESSTFIDTRCYSNICHSIGKLRVDNNNDDSTRRIFNHLSNATFAKAFLDDGNPQDISNLAWSLARLQRPDLMNHLLHQMDEECRNKLFTGKPQAPAIVLWACATLGQSSPELLAAMEQHADWLLGKGDTQNVSNTAWACATLGYAAPALFHAIDRNSPVFVARGEPHSVTDTAWACAKLGHAAPSLFEAICKRSDWLVTNGTPQGIANTAWACATLGHDAFPLFRAIQGRAELLVSVGDPQATSTTAWACAKLGHTTPALFTAIQNHAERLVTNGTTQTIANTAWACGKLRHATVDFFVALDQRAEWLVANGQVQEVVNTAYASARLGHPSPALFTAIVNRWDWLLENGNRQDVDGTLWAFKKLKHTLPK